MGSLGPSDRLKTGRTVVLPRGSNQARGLARYAIAFLLGDPQPIGAATLDRLEQFHLDSVGCGVSALAMKANAPTVLRREALAAPPSLALAGRRTGALCFGASRFSAVEKVVAANVSAVREWDSNGTNFGYDPLRGRTAGEFGHNDFYPVAIAAAHLAGLDGNTTLRLMLLIDEIRGRLAEVFALRKYAIDHVHHGAVASAVAFTAALGGTEDQIESAVGLVVAHYVPFRAIRAGHQLSDSKGASAALAAETAVISSFRALAGFVGPADVFRNPLAIYRLNQPCPEGESPFDLELGQSEDAFAIHGMHFKLGLYEHQSAGAIAALINLLTRFPALAGDIDGIRALRVKIYEPAFSIIADPAKRWPSTRQSADHSLPYIVARTLWKARVAQTPDWAELMLLPEDYDDEAIGAAEIRVLIEKIAIEHGGREYDEKYPDGIPTSLQIDHVTAGVLESGLVQYPLGHARSDPGRTAAVLDLKFTRLVAAAVDDPQALRERMKISGRSIEEIAELYAFSIHGCDPG
ncbi:MAG: MmgE/PrpD family protein [Planctomycetota bacterium]